jgi:hypothetical protein
MIEVYTSDLSEGPSGDVVVVHALSDSQAKYNTLKTNLCSKSTRAKEIFELLEGRPEVIGVFINGGDESMTSEYYPPGFASDIFRVPSQFTGGLVILDVGRSIYVTYPKTDRRGPLPLDISLAHELGHAEQFFTKRDWFMHHFSVVNSLDSSVGSDVRKREKLIIEDDNLARNERVICEQYGLPTRNHYD